jgi:hypothetical protein
MSFVIYLILSGNHHLASQRYHSPRDVRTLPYRNVKRGQAHVYIVLAKLSQQPEELARLLQRIVSRNEFQPLWIVVFGRGYFESLSSESVRFARTTNRIVIWYTRKWTKRCLKSPFCELASS